MKRSTLMWSGAAITAILLGTFTYSCSGKLPLLTSTSLATLGVTATTVNRLDSAGQVTGRQINLVWANLPANTARVTLARSTGSGTKDLTVDNNSNTYADLDVTADTSYNYTVTALDANANTIGSGTLQGVKLGGPAAATAPVLTVPVSNTNVNPTETVQLKWTLPNPAPSYVYIEVASALSKKVVASLIVNGNETEARIPTQRIAAPRTDSAVAGTDIPNLNGLLPINTRGTLTEDLPYQATLTFIYSDQASLASAGVVTLRSGASVEFKLPSQSSYFMGS